MSYTVNCYADGHIWNVQAPQDIVISNGIKLVSDSSSSGMHAEVTLEGVKYELRAEGTFSYPANATSLADVTGVMYKSYEYQNGILAVVQSYSNGADPVKLMDDFEYEKSLLAGDDRFYGSSASNEQDEVMGLGGNDLFKGFGDGTSSGGSSGRDRFYGGDGIDTAVYRGTFGVYNIKSIDYMWDARADNGTRIHGLEVVDRVANRDGTDELNAVERLKFSDTMVGLDVGKGENTGEVYRLYLSVLGRNPQADAEGCGFWIDKLDRTVYSIDQIVGDFLNSQEFVARFGSSTSSNDSFVNLLYQNMLGRDGHSDPGFNFWVGVLNNQQGSRAQVVVGFMESPENVAAAAPLIGDTPTYQQWVG